MLARCHDFQVRREPVSRMLDFFDPERFRFVIHNFDVSLVPFTPLSGYEKRWPGRQLDWRDDMARKGQMDLRLRRFIQEDQNCSFKLSFQVLVSNLK